MLWYNYLYENTMCTNKQGAALLYFKRKDAWEEGWGKEWVALIKSLITREIEKTRLRRRCQIELKMSADILIWAKNIELNANSVHLKDQKYANREIGETKARIESVNAFRLNFEHIFIEVRTHVNWNSNVFWFKGPFK